MSTRFCVICNNVLIHKEEKTEKKIILFCKFCDKKYSTEERLFYKNILKKEVQTKKPEEIETVQNIELDPQIAKQLKGMSYLCEDPTLQPIIFDDDEDACENCGGKNFVQFQNKGKTHLSHFEMFYQCKTPTCRKIYQNKMQNREDAAQDAAVV